MQDAPWRKDRADALRPRMSMGKLPEQSQPMNAQVNQSIAPNL
jgi:hypothetical protein